jgi:hypothetical protein
MAGKKSLYVESTIPSYATSKASGNALNLLRQAQTKDFWDNYSNKFSLFVGDPVVTECRRGDKEAAARRMDFIKGIPVLELTGNADALAIVYQKLLEIPENAQADCEHLAICVLNRIDFLLSWNMTHLGPTTWNKTRTYNDAHRLWTPTLVTPESIHPYLRKGGIV